MITAVEAWDTSLGAPGVRIDLNEIEKRTDVLGTDHEERLDAGAAGRDLAIGLQYVEDGAGPAGEQAIVDAAVEVDTGAVPAVVTAIAECNAETGNGDIAAQQLLGADLSLGSDAPGLRVG